MPEPSPKRFTLDGSPALEKRLEQICEAARHEILSIIPEPRLTALVLGGGYGRGQGGVLRTLRGDEPYNDMEFYVFMRGNRLLNARRYQRDVAALEQRLSLQSGIHVEFKIDSLDKLRRSPVSMFSYDLVAGHRVVFGPEDVFRECAHHLDATAIPVSEATRLLFNRCSGLLLAKELLLSGELSHEQLDFVSRNIAKCELAMGDAVLCAEGLYSHNVRERHQRLQKLGSNRVGIDGEEWIAVKRHHFAGMEFKLHPSRTGLDASLLRTKHDVVANLSRRVWLAVESSRLHHSFASPKAYASDKAVKWEASPSWLNYILNLRSFGLRAAMDYSAWRYPRERLLKALPVLLWEDPVGIEDLQPLLHAQGTDWHALVRAYKEVWPSYG